MLEELNEARRKIGLPINRRRTQFMENQWCNNKNIRLNGPLITETSTYVFPWPSTEYGKQHEGGTRQKKEGNPTLVYLLYTRLLPSGRCVPAQVHDV
ncbi:hypothetical protein KIN20_003028 [Parelaphostrongylus tenuis]|uniref:Uncharacterized protein n=1 Tax=Parelaphostrongylus tenuis TaxID=148309 RepID=A0AAD5QDC2_PARTN|nr:hypothetical protein KIN20_003028 [Parelaphostrongylus tenuis]